jgi:hypothetical protein
VSVCVCICVLGDGRRSASLAALVMVVRKQVPHVGAAFVAMRAHRPTVRIKRNQLAVLLAAETLLMPQDEPVRAAAARAAAAQVTLTRTGGVPLATPSSKPASQ